uniref:Peptidase C1A papain C-terminal domain-containing protein n=1 Tax=Pyrodinium bahamense TaxID=73915 RepID=A0A7S0APF7_9DINO|mmetsp:Transcript_39097/g.108743  ORF Transcript_39097/g.108743 Transcript_39097/m.108743 type:complete len:460 (+) Transcript_39097:103-1482(+)
MPRLMAAALLGLFLVPAARGWRAAGGLRAKSALAARSALEGYSFAQYIRDFSRPYSPGSEEHQRRAAIFEASLAEVHTTNARNAKEGRGWKAGIHPFMDWTLAERRVLNGYKPPRGHRHSQAVALLHEGASAFGRSSMASRLNASFSEEGGLSADMGPALRQQGNCGSCWAISAVEAVEAQLLRSGAPPSTRLSAQALVDCVPNPQHCGGSGGCDGATGELAYAFMRDHGIPLESDLPYTARTSTCPQVPLDGPWHSMRRARVSGWSQLPSNQAEPLKSALVSQGPVVVAVDGNNWFNYDSGVFDSCEKDAILGHAVLAKGYGSDAGRSYWLIQNSWGSDWGENGHIRMLMHDDEEQWCGVDRKPQEGVGCDGGPAEVTVCGMCGILYDPVVPQGVRLEGIDSATDDEGLGSGVAQAEGSDTATAVAGNLDEASPGASAGSGVNAEAQMDALLRNFSNS